MDSAHVSDDVRSFFASSDADVIAVYLYGSLARGSATASSDVDLAVLYRNAPGRTFDALPLALEAELEHLLGREVQLLVLNEAPVDLVHRVLRDGKVLVERDRAARIRFEVRARNEFFDLTPILEQYRKAAITRR
jgi:uncharacterized protein